VRVALLIAAKDLRQRLRDRSAIVVGIVAPLAIAALMSLAFKGSETFRFNLGVVNADGGPVAASLVKSLGQPALAQVISLSRFDTAAQADAAVRTNTVQAALVIPSGFSTSMSTSTPRSLVTLTSADNVTAANVTASIATSFVAQLNADRLSVATAAAAGARNTPSLQAAAGLLSIPEQVAQRPIGAHQLRAISYFSPAMAIFFLLFIIGYTARSFFVDRGQGMIERMRAAPVTPLQILAGKALSVFAFGVVSLATVAVVTSVGFGANWGTPVAAAAVGLAMVTAVVCLTALVIGVTRTQRQAEAVSSAIVFGLALLGGNFVFLSTAPDVMRRLALFTPNGWAMRAFTDLATTGGGLRAVEEPVLAILAFSAVVGLAAATLAGRAVTA